MSIIKNEIPILEYDSEKQAVIMPNHEGFDFTLPRKAEDYRKSFLHSNRN